jgi:sec-independent protein translocase protein TatC
MKKKPSADSPHAEGSLIFHLIELRSRMLRMATVILLIFLALAPFADMLFAAIANPLMERLPEGTSMIATQVASPFLTPFKTAMVAAVFVAMPWILYQVWAFVAPGLYQHEKRLAMPLVITSALLFYGGVAFAYYVVFPLMFAFFTAVAPEGVSVMTDINAYLDFVLTLFFAFGLAFEVPIATVLMVWAGFTTPARLASHRAYVLLGAFVFGMLLTPPDVISQTLLAVPVYILYEAGILMAKVMVPGHREVESQENG